jgi:hypothetical protein
MARRIGRAIYFVLKNKEAFHMKRFFTYQAVENLSILVFSLANKGNGSLTRDIESLFGSINP